MKFSQTLLVLLLCLAALYARAAGVSTNVPNGKPSRMHIVTCRDGVDVDALLKEHRIAPRFRYGTLKGFAAPMASAAIQRLKSDPRVLFVEADGRMKLCNQTIPAGLVRMGIHQFPVAHINGTPKPLDVDVAVLDTGIAPHPDLNVHQFFSPFTSDGNDEYGHGTGVAGIIGATDNGFGVVGVAPGVRIWNVKVFAPEHDAWSHFLSGLDYVVQNSNEISVASISIGNDDADAPFASIRNGIRRLIDAGIVVVAAAGNEAGDIAGPDNIFGTGDDQLPAALPEVMAVSAIDSGSDTFAWWSNFSRIERTNGYTSGGGPAATNYVFSPGRAIDVAAPGLNVFTTSASGGYGIFSGTSYAAPHVAGLVALYIAANGRATNAEGVYRIRQAIVDASLPQSQWNANNTLDPDTNPEPLAIATENWVPLPSLTSASAPGNFQLSFNAVPGYDHAVQSASDLNRPVAWTNVATISGTGKVAVVSFTDTNVANRSFYRLARDPSP